MRSKDLCHNTHRAVHIPNAYNNLHTPMSSTCNLDHTCPYNCCSLDHLLDCSACFFCRAVQWFHLLSCTQVLARVESGCWTSSGDCSTGHETASGCQVGWSSCLALQTQVLEVELPERSADPVQPFGSVLLAP